MADEQPTPRPSGDATADAIDHFGPPAEPCECFCLHCRRVVLSSDMWFQRVVNPTDSFRGFWMCPTPNCDGKGFTFDLWPTDPDHPANDGWSDDDDEDGDGGFDDDDETDGEFRVEDEVETEYDPAEPQYAADGFDDLDGEEWKFGLQPGEQPPSPAVDADRAAREAQERQYDEPDRRPRTIDPHDRPKRDWGPISDDDIPF